LPVSIQDLERGELEVEGLLPFASNFSYLAKLCFEGGEPEIRVVYKPLEGEAPLWDFPSGTLCRRETAAFVVSEAAGWGMVPPTVLREGPLGVGAVQVFVDHDPRITAFDLVESHPVQLRQVVLFDLVANNADRKAGHVLLDRLGKVWSVDHGICFHTDYKLRTVLWDFVGDRITEADKAPIRNLSEALEQDLPSRLSALLAPDEIRALKMRAGKVAQLEAFPPPGPGRHFPWPPV
jgi:uncharacterized repeat protein (TIGR03843 family)